ncbi:TnpV protein [Sporosalibacterium faouarense]|uniref:TnpV protein n=1 Tax=Sporosalibacterium faouarense TaxID=516123 RepID=UPI00192A79E8|nr:TnpV protein [Sporosalibacterium faouarense]
MSEIKYVRKGDYYYPEIDFGIDENVEFRKYGRLRYKYLKENKPYLFSRLLLEGELMKHVIEIEKQAYERFERIQQEYLREHPLPADGNFVESYKIRQEAHDVAEEVVLEELIYD